MCVYVKKGAGHKPTRPRHIGAMFGDGAHKGLRASWLLQARFKLYSKQEGL